MLDYFNDDDLVSHYTSTEVALDYILRDSSLRLSPRRNTFDPLENSRIFLSHSSVSPYEDSYFGKNNTPEIQLHSKEIQDELYELLDNIKQLCLCKNAILKNEKGISVLPPEKYSFMKPRMWDQYADKYKGVCLVFSLKELKKNIGNNIMFGDVKYKNFSSIGSSYHTIEHRNIIQHGKEYEMSRLKKVYLENKLLNKHKDYSNENEFRFYTSSSNTFEFINFDKNALKAIIYSDIGINKHLEEAFVNLKNQYTNTTIFNISFGNSEPHITPVNKL